jgi:hypothetical protein
MADATIASSTGFTRWQAAGTHLLISVVIAIAALFVLLRVWYPPPLFKAEGGNELLFILVAVDVVIGPLITLIVFKSGKPGLRFDLSVIALLQAAALAYGCYTMFVARPVFITFIVDRFEIVRANDIDPAELALAPNPAFRSVSLTGPQIIAVEMPRDINALKELIAEAQKGGKVAQHLPKFYVPYSAKREQIAELSQTVDSALKRGGDLAAAANKFLAESGRKASELRYLPLQTRRGLGVVFLEANTGEIVKLLPPPDV